MLRYICGNTMTYHIPNVNFRRLLGVESISEKIREGGLRWCEHVQRKCNSNTCQSGVGEREVGPVGRELNN